MLFLGINRTSCEFEGGVGILRFVRLFHK